METIVFDKEAYIAEAIADGINLAKNFVSVNSLPASGVFQSYENRSKGTKFAHTAVLTSGGGSCSIGALAAIICDENNADLITEYTNENGTFFQYPTSAHNPALTGHPADILAKIIGKSFTTTEIKGYVGKFVEGGALTANAVKIIPKTMYKITIKD